MLDRLQIRNDIIAATRDKLTENDDEFTDFYNDNDLILNREQFKEQAKQGNNHRDKFIASIEEVAVTKTDIKIITKDSIFKIRYDGSLSTRTSRSTGRTYLALIRKGHQVFSLNSGATDLFVESLVYFAHCFINNLYPESFKNLAVNMIDGSGNIKEKGYYNYDPSNLELTTVKKNLSHSKKFGVRINK